MMRPTITGTSATARPQQQSTLSFKPKSDWKHEDEAIFLFVYLPGFAVEQLTITSDYSNRTVKIEGQRRLPNNKLLPVNETFAIPEDCDLSKMDKQFGRGVLILKLPKNIVIPQQLTTKETKEETPMPQEPVGDSMARKGGGFMNPPEETSKRSPVRSAVIPLVTATGDKKSTMTAAKSDEEKLTEWKDENAGDGKPDKPEGPGVKEEENKAESKESATSGSAMSVAKFEEKEKKKSPNLADAKGKETKENANGSPKQGIVKELNQDRKLMANMGAAVMIIVGLGISILYLRS